MSLKGERMPNNKRFHDALEVNFIRRTECIELIKDWMEYNNLKIVNLDLLMSWDEKDKRKLKKMRNKLIENLEEMTIKLKAYDVLEVIEETDCEK